MEVFDQAERRAATGAEVIRLEVGQPSTGAPAGVIERAHRVLDDDRLGYTSPQGVPELREAIAEHYANTSVWAPGAPPVNVDPDDIVVTVGASGAFTLAFLAAFDIGQRVAVTIPGYPCYRNALEALGIDVVPLVTDFDDNFQPTIAALDALAAEGSLDGLVVTSPSNPTGTMVGRDRYAEIVRWCESNGVTLVSDEIYHGLSYGESASTALEHGRDLIVVNSFSKYFSMTGWRLGWLVLPSHFVDPVMRFAANLLLNPPTLSQYAAVAAFKCHDELQGHLTRYRSNRDVLLEGLPSAGLDRLAPADGAFYVYADVSELTGDSQKLCAEWLDQLGIAATPGVDFDPIDGHRYVRFSFPGATQDMHRAVELLQGWYQAR